MAVLTLPNSDALSVRAKALVFEDPLSRALLARIQQVAPSDATVLIVGETGTGKEIVARHLHELSGRGGPPFVAVNCGALLRDADRERAVRPRDGARSPGALGAKAGWFETRRRRHAVPRRDRRPAVAVQVKLLRVLQEREVVRLGARARRSRSTCGWWRRPTSISRRRSRAGQVSRGSLLPAGGRGAVAAAAARAPRRHPAAGALLPERLPPAPAARRGRCSIRRPSGCSAHAWPGNIRELENAIHHALLVCRDGRMIAADLRAR